MSRAREFCESFSKYMDELDPRAMQEELAATCDALLASLRSRARRAREAKRTGGAKKRTAGNAPKGRA